MSLDDEWLPPIDNDSDALLTDDGGISMGEFPPEGLLLAEEQISLSRKRKPYRKRELGCVMLCTLSILITEDSV